MKHIIAGFRTACRAGLIFAALVLPGAASAQLNPCLFGLWQRDLGTVRGELTSRYGAEINDMRGHVRMVLNPDGTGFVDINLFINFESAGSQVETTARGTPGLAYVNDAATLSIVPNGNYQIQTVFVDSSGRRYNIPYPAADAYFTFLVAPMTGGYACTQNSLLVGRDMWFR